MQQLKLDSQEKAELASSILDFWNFALKVIPNLQVVKKQLRAIREVKTQDIGHNKQFFKMLETYEGENVLCYQNNDEDKLVFTKSKENPEILMSMEELRDTL